jgi:tetratricopeptide (TPR) repeat protein
MPTISSQKERPSVGHFPPLILGRTSHHNAPEEPPSLQLQLREAARTDRPAVSRITDYEAIALQAPMLEEAQAQLGKLYKLTGQLQQSVLHYKQAFQLCQHPQQRAKYANEAAIGCALLDKTQHAYPWWKKAIELDPTFLPPALSLAHALEDNNSDQLAEAITLLATAQQHHPTDIRLCYSLSRMYSKQNQWALALAQYQLQLPLEQQESVSPANPNGVTDPWTYTNMATCCLQLQAVEQAKAYFNQAIAVAPNSEAADFAKLVLEGLSFSDALG